MKTEKPPESPNSDDSSVQKEDPLERRRLQNRLSQRNHRRKIRDRIAKLQERVIANELRAAAALNGWDQQYAPSPLISNRHVSPSHFNINHRDRSSDEPSAQYPQSYIPVAPWSRDMAPLSPMGLVGDQTCFINGDFPTGPMYSLPSTLDWTGNTGIQPSGRGNEDVFQNLSNAVDSLSTEAYNNPSQPLYYVATETALPQILQVLSTVSPQSKIIVIVPPNSASAAAAGYPSPASTLSGNGMEPLSSTHINKTLPYECQTQLAPGTWSAPGPYVSRFPSHKIHGSSAGGFSGMRL